MFSFLSYWFDAALRFRLTCREKVEDGVTVNANVNANVSTWNEEGERRVCRMITLANGLLIIFMVDGG